MPKRKFHKLPSIGSSIVRVFKKREYRLIIVNVGGSIGYKYGGKVYRSPSGAAKAIIGREINGWKFWGLD